MIDEKDTQNYISLQEASQYCCYSQEYLSLRARQKKLKALKFGRNWVTKKNWLDEYLNRVEGYKEQISNKKADSPPTTFLIREKQGVVPVAKFSATGFRFGLTLFLTFALLVSSLAFIFPKLSNLKKADLIYGFENLDYSLEKFGHSFDNFIFSDLVSYTDTLGDGVDSFAENILNGIKEVNDLRPWLAAMTFRDFADYNLKTFKEYGQWFSQQALAFFKRTGDNVKIIGSFIVEELRNSLRVVSNSFKSFAGQIKKIPQIVFKSFKSFVGSFKKIPQFVVQLFKKVTEKGIVVEKSVPASASSTEKEIEELKKQIAELKEKGIVVKEITKEVSRITQIEPIKEITYEKIISRIDEGALANLNVQIADLQTDMTKRLYAPGGVISQQIYVTEPVASPKFYQENADIVLQAAGTGSVILSAGVGMQISGSQVLIDSTSALTPLIYLADKTRIGGDTDIEGTVSVAGFKMGTDAATGYVLTSDGSGVGTWQASTGSGADSDWVISGTTMYATDTISYLGIGTTSPSSIFTIATDTEIFAIDSDTGVVATGTWKATPLTIGYLNYGNATTDEYCLTYEETGEGFEWQACGTGGGDTWVLDSGLGYATDTVSQWLIGGTATATADSILEVIGTSTFGAFTIDNLGNASTSGNFILTGSFDYATITDASVTAWDLATDQFNASSTNWESTYLTVTASSTNWDNAYVGWNASNTNWDWAADYLIASSSYIDIVRASSTNWDWAADYLIASSSYIDIVRASSTAWDLATDQFNASSTNWESTYLTVTASSTNWDNAYVGWNASNTNWDWAADYLIASSSYIDIVRASSTAWDLATDQFNASSTNWESTYLTVTASSTNWDNAYVGWNASNTNWDWAADYLIASSTRIESAVNSAFNWILSGSTLYATDTFTLVGIGTSTPNYGLEVMSSSTAGYLGVSGSTQGDVFIINASGNVGIATATPAYALDVWGNAAFGSTTIPLLLANSDTGRVGVNTTTPAYDVDIWGSLAVGTTTVPDLFVNSDTGYVGIGTTTPQTALHIGTASSTQLTSFDDSLMVSGELEVSESAYFGPMEFPADSGAVSWIDMTVSSTTASNTVESYTARLGGTDILTIYGEADGIDGGILEDTGRVGIGTTTPVYGLEIISSSTAGFFGISSSTQGDTFVINTMGNVGIATATPAYNLDVWGNAAFGSTTIPLLLANSDTGRVGVNTTTPAYDVDIWGSLAVGTTDCAGFVC